MYKTLYLTYALLTFCLFSQAKGDGYVYPNDTVITVNNNQLTLAAHIDSIYATDPITGQHMIVLEYHGHRSVLHNDSIKLHRVPVLLNGSQIYSPLKHTDIEHYTQLDNSNQYLIEYLTKKMRRHYRRIEKAGYNADIRNIVVNREGAIVYYEYSGLYQTDTFNDKQLNNRFTHRMNRKTERLLDKVELQPAMLGEDTIAYRVDHYTLL